MRLENRTWLYAIALGAIAGSGVGLACGVYELLVQDYWAHGLRRLAFATLARSLDAWVVPSVALALWVGGGLGLARALAATNRWLQPLTLAATGLSGGAGLAWITALAQLLSPRAAVLAGALCALVTIGIGLRRARTGHASLPAPRAVATGGLAALLTLAALHLPGFVESSAGGRAPNVVVIVVDTLRADHVGCYGAEHPTTPSIDRFAAGAIQFHDALAVAPWTTPSIAAMLSSRYPSEVSWRHPPVPLAPSVVSLPELFKDAGYRTGAIVSHLYVSRQLGFDQGFDLYDQDNARGHRHISSPSVTRKALDFLERHQDERFFLFLHYFDPHSDFLRHARYDFFPDYAGPVRPDAPLGELLRQAPEMSAEDLRYVRALYDSEIRFTDDHVGWVLTRLRELGLYDDALIVITSDHGEEFAERGTHYIGHGTHLHRELLHVPLLIKPPHHTGHRDVEQAVSLIDLAPTLVRAAGLDAFDPVWFRGRALPLDGTRIPAAPAFSDNAGRRLSVVSGGWKLMRDGDPPRDRLFELATDPTEQRDRLADHPEHARTLRAALETWLTATSQTTRVEGTASFTPEQQEQLRALGYAE